MKFNEREERDLAPNPLAAYLDAERRSSNNRSRFSVELKQRASKLFELATQAYPKCRLYQNYREKFIAVKVENAQQPNDQALTMLYDFCERHNVYAVKLGTNLVYRVYNN